MSSAVAAALQSYTYISELMANFSGEQWLTRGKMEMAFIKVVCPGDVLTVKATVKGKMPEGSGIRIVFDVWCENRNEEKVSVGTANCLIP